CVLHLRSAVAGDDAIRESRDRRIDTIEVIAAVADSDPPAPVAMDGRLDDLDLETRPGGALVDGDPVAAVLEDHRIRDDRLRIVRYADAGLRVGDGHGVDCWHGRSADVDPRIGDVDESRLRRAGRHP